MSVAEIGQLHNRYVRLSDTFKAVWTYNQFASGVYKNFLQQPLPYRIDFQKLYEEIRKAGDLIQTATPAHALPLMEDADRELQATFKQLLVADEQITASVLRRFFEKLRRQDDKIIFHLIKFYLYASGAAERDKLDFLFTRISEDVIEGRNDTVLKDTSELRKTFQGLLSSVQIEFPPPAEISALVAGFHEIRDEIIRSQTFDTLTDQNLLQRSRELKQRAGNGFLHPDVMVGVVECNITTKNRFALLYRDEEHRILEDARRLIENEQAIARGFGESNPELMDEMVRFKQFKQEFDDSRAQSNVKANVIASLKSSMANILSQLDRGLDQAGEVEELSESFFLDAQQLDTVQAKFGDDPLLQTYLMRIVSVLDSFDPDSSGNRIALSPEAKNLRLEPWEVGAFEKLYWLRSRNQGENDELLLLYLRAAALRLKIDEEAREVNALQYGDAPSANLLDRVRATLDRAKEFDETFKDYLQEGLYSNPKNLHRLYRSRLRLLRSYSGLWLIYDQFAEHE
jgi:hypothetical protein